MRRRAFIVSAASALTCGSHAASLRPKPLLTVGGNIGRINDEASASYRFTEEEFLALPQATITTSTTWTPKSRFDGPKLIDVMHAVKAATGRLKFSTIDDYSAVIPWDDLEGYGVILAHSQNGKRLEIKRWGPLWSIYPRDEFAELNSPHTDAKFIWQTTRIDVI